MTHLSSDTREFCSNVESILVTRHRFGIPHSALISDYEAVLPRSMAGFVLLSIINLATLCGLVTPFFLMVSSGSDMVRAHRQSASPATIRGAHHLSGGGSQNAHLERHEFGR